MKRIILALAVLSFGSLVYAQNYGYTPAWQQKQGKKPAASASKKPAAQKKRTTNAVAGAKASQSSLDTAIEAQVAAQAPAAYQAEAKHVANHPGEKIKANSQDSRRVTMNGQEYKLRKKEHRAGKDSASVDTHTYISDATGDTVQVIRRDKGAFYYMGDVYNHTTTSSEQLPRANGYDRIVGCEKKNSDGSCHYVVKRVQVDKSDGHGGTVVTAKRNIPAGTSPSDKAKIKTATYQSVRNTDPQAAFGKNFDGRSAIYGPETYPNDNK